MGLWARQRAGEDVTGLVHHSDRGVQYRAVRYEIAGDYESWAARAAVARLPAIHARLDVVDWVYVAFDVDAYAYRILRLAHRHHDDHGPSSTRSSRPTGPARRQITSICRPPPPP